MRSFHCGVTWGAACAAMTTIEGQEVAAAISGFDLLMFAVDLNRRAGQAGDERAADLGDVAFGNIAGHLGGVGDDVEGAALGFEQ